MGIEKYIQPDNPTDEERHEMLRLTLEEANRGEDFDNLIELLGTPKDITEILPEGRCRGSKIGIIGGGLAGLASAFELRKLGFDITIFEMEKERIGGRVYTYYFDKEKKLYGELGAMRIPVSHETVWHYINLFGLETKPFIQVNDNAFIYVRNIRTRNDPKGKEVKDKIYPEFNLAPWEREKSWQELQDYALGSELIKIDPKVRREILEVRKKYSPIIQKFGKLSIRNVLEKSGLSEGAIEMLSGVNPFLTYLYNNSYFENLQEQYTVDYANRYYISGGMDKLPLAFYEALLNKSKNKRIKAKNDCIGTVICKNGYTVTGIYKEEINKVKIRYIDNKTSKTCFADFDYVICAIPFSSLRNVEILPMFTTEKMQAIREISYTAAQKTLFSCNKSFWESGNKEEKIIGGVSVTDIPIANIWYPSNLSIRNKGKIKYKNHKNISSNPGVLLAAYNLGQDAIRVGNVSEKERIEGIKRQVEEVHGLPKCYLDSVVEDYETINWNTKKGFYGAFCYYMPNQQRLFAYAAEKPEYNERVYFAGEHISMTHAWMQGALKTGMNAANAIAKHYRRDM